MTYEDAISYLEFHALEMTDSETLYEAIAAIKAKVALVSETESDLKW